MKYLAFCDGMLQETHHIRRRREWRGGNFFDNDDLRHS